MATILFCWELGGGLGHVAPYLTFANELSHRGHRLIFALRQTGKAARLLQQTGHTYLQAPLPGDGPTNPVRLPCTYPHILYNSEYHDPATLLGLVRTWRALFTAVRPDSIICQHAPTALLASRGLRIKRITMGSGFCLPPDIYPLPNLRDWLDIDEARLRRDEDGVRDTINRVLGALKVGSLERISQLFDTDANILRTLKEFDPYAQHRPEAEYWGTHPGLGGDEPVWPAGHRPRIFAYLKPSPLVPEILDKLSQLGISGIVVCDGISKKIRDRYTDSSLRIAGRPLDMRRVAGECDAAILNATLNSTVHLLMVGKPILMLPLTLEQYLTARSVEQLGAGLDISRLRGEPLVEAVGNFLASRRYAERHNGVCRPLPISPVQQSSEPLHERFERGLLRRADTSPPQTIQRKDGG
jgi:UDP:flavonoid glycosyltransferase YjiC (YdhE family)